MDGSVLAVLAAYQNNLVTSKMMTSQVDQSRLFGKPSEVLKPPIFLWPKI